LLEKPIVYVRLVNVAAAGGEAGSIEHARLDDGECPREDAERRVRKGDRRCERGSSHGEPE
jgi:hypothetical protein